MIDNRTQRLDLPLPDVDNYLEEDVARLKEAFTTLDQKVATVNDAGKLSDEQIPSSVALLDTNDKLPAANLPTSAVQKDANGKIPAEVVPVDELTAVTDLAERVSALEARKYTTLIPSTLPSGAPHDAHETVVSELPANVAANSRYVLPNPFGQNTRVQVTAELYLNGRWAEAGYDGNTGNGLVSVGTVGIYVQGEGIIVQTGTINVASQSALLGGGHGITSTASYATAPCRVFVSKLEA